MHSDFFKMGRTGGRGKNVSTIFREENEETKGTKELAKRLPELANYGTVNRCELLENAP